MSINKDQAQKAAGVMLDDLVPSRSGLQVEPRVPRTAPGQLMDLQGKYREALTTIERLSEGGVPRELPINRLARVPGRQRPLTASERSELKANLIANPLIHPITVLPETADGFELLSGYNRVELYEELGRTTISAMIIDVPRETAEVLAFYANLLAPALPDYKKFGGLKARQAQMKFNLTQLSDESGMSTSTISRLFQFENLPAPALAILDRDPFILGATAAESLAKAAKAGRGDLVVQAVTKLAEAAGNKDKKLRFTEENAVAYANGLRPAAKLALAEPLVVKQGKKNFAKVMARGDQVTIRFADPSVSTTEWASRLEAFLKAEIAKDAE